MCCQICTAKVAQKHFSSVFRKVTSISDTEDHKEYLISNVKCYQSAILTFLAFVWKRELAEGYN